MIKSLIPIRLKLIIRLFINLLNDLKNGYLFYFAKSGELNFAYSDKNTLRQDLSPNDAKVHNLKLAIKSIESVPIFPNEIFSFWNIVGKPSKRNGFRESRSILGDKIEKTVGGGLCQLSGLIYYLSLISNLEIIERHNHSIDIYNDETRFTPLGSDAAVAYGYKDLKVKNNSKNPIHFSFQITEEKLIIELHHCGNLSIQKIAFNTHIINSLKIEVETISKDKILAKSSYKRQSKI